MVTRVPPPPKPPALPAEQEARGSWLSIFLTLLMCAAAYIVLSFVTLNVFGPVLIIAGVVFLVVSFHYLVWGWWLGKVIRDAHEEDGET
jgi:hypothetical protein